MPAIYLVIFDLTRFRDLRKADDDFGSRRSAAARRPSPVEAVRDDPPRRARR